MLKLNRWVAAVLSLLLLAGFAGGGAWAQSSASAYVGASVMIVAPIALAKDADINFGVVVAGSAGTLVVTPAGVNASNPAMRIDQQSAGTTGRFVVTGEGSHTYFVKLPQPVVLRHENDVLELSNFQSYADGSSSQASKDNIFSLTLGSGAFRVGATLTVPSNSQPGAYLGSFPVTIAYN